MAVSQKPARSRAPQAVFALVAICALWGLTFVIVKRAIAEVPPFEFLAIRFAIASFALAVVFPKQVARMSTGVIVGGVVAGVALAAGYGFQTTGLQFTSATNAGFVTGLYVIFAPLLGTVLLRKFPERGEWVAVMLAASGLALLTLGPNLRVMRGDVLVLGCAVSFAVHIVLLGRFSPVYDSRQLAIVQLAVSALGFGIIAVAAEPLVIPSSAEVWSTIALTSVGASAIAFLAQTWAQSHLNPTKTAVTLTMEPVFAGLAGFFLLGERLTPRGWMGALFILVGMLIAARTSPQRKNRRHPEPAESFS